MSDSSQSQFIHLRCHSEYSISDGIVRIPDYVKKALETNLNAIKFLIKNMKKKTKNNLYKFKFRLWNR